MNEKSRHYRDYVVGGYLSPNNRQSHSRIQQSLLSPSSLNRFPPSQKYSSPFPARPLLAQHYSPSHLNQTDIIETSELRLTVAQLKQSLQIATQNSQRIQEQLFAQRKRSYELIEVKRRLEEELEKLEFELQRMGSHETLEGRQTSIKLETALRENARIGHQIADLLDENKSLKQEQRKLMTQVDTLLRERSVLANENENLLRQLQQLEKEVASVRQQLQSPSSLLKIPTHRSQRVPTAVASASSIPLEPLQEVDYELESEKLLEDYQKLLVENQSIKRLKREFFSSETQKPELFRERPRQKVSHPAAQQQAQGIRSFSNHHIAEKLNSERSHDDAAESPMFRTGQQRQLKEELQQVRSQAVQEVRRCYTKSLKEAESKKNNALKTFLEELGKNVGVLGRMAQNYLELRATVREEAGVQLPEPVDEIAGESAPLLKMYRSVKEKAKKEGAAGLGVAIFRLLTLLSRCQSLPQVLVDNMQHSCMKYVYKLANCERIPGVCHDR